MLGHVSKAAISNNALSRHISKHRFVGINKSPFEREVEWNMRPARSISKSCRWTSKANAASWRYGRTDPDPELHDLVITLLTRIGMIMEDVSPVALDARSGGVHARAHIVSEACTKIGALTAAVHSLIRE